VDISRIAELIGRSRDEAIAELDDRIFLDPQLTIEHIESWQTTDAYLSGPVAPNSPPPSLPPRSILAISATSKPFARSSPKI